MLVGYIRNAKKPDFFAQLLSMICKYRGIDLIYTTPKGVDIEKGTIKGKVFIDGKWKKTEVDLPLFIDISPRCFKDKNIKVTNYLREHTLLSDDRTNKLSKRKLQNKLKEDKQFQHLVIPTKKAKDYENLEEFLEIYPTIVMKPISGGRGRGVYILRKDKETESYILGYRTEEKRLSSHELKEFFIENIKEYNYILQKYISSRTLQGDPFDCRIHVEKNGKGKWTVARMIIRIGIGQKVMSNVNQGGGISDVEPFLKANFGEKWEEINENINHLAESLPYKIEELRETSIMTLGLDIAVDKDGKLFIFESNGSPSTNFLTSEIAVLRSAYYKYVLQSQLGVKDTRLIEKSKDSELKRVKSVNQKLIKEAEKAEKNLLEIKSSLSWRLTKPLRSFKKIVKK